jgi:hypothetical protein
MYRMHLKAEALFKSDFIMRDKNYRFKKRKKVLMTSKKYRLKTTILKIFENPLKF